MENKELNTAIGRNISKYLNMYQMTQEDLAIRINVTKQAVSSWVKGIRAPRMDKVDKICEVFGCQRSELIETEKEKEIRINQKHTIFLLGRVAAGEPIYAEQNIIDLVDVPAQWANRQEFFALKIKGVSMEPKICDGDIVIVHSQSTANNGDVVIATINGDDAVCKKLMIYGNTTILRSFNSEFEDIIIENKRDFRIYGKVLELRRII